MKLHAGDVVEVKTLEEILATLDGQASQGALPFMPEMMRYAGQRFRVSKRADKTCDTIKSRQNRRMTQTVHLDDLRCDGSAHGGCQAACLLFWKESWLRRVDSPEPPAAHTSQVQDSQVLALEAGTKAHDDPPGGEIRYRCQATQIREATTPMRWWDPRQYARDLLSGNVTLTRMLRVIGSAMLRAIQRKIGRSPDAPIMGTCTSGTPRVHLGLKLGDSVTVRSHDEIASTLTPTSKNRGLWYDWEMKPFSGGTYRVKDRVSRLIDERTGHLITIPHADCLMLDGVVCSGELSRGRLFCPRAITPYWREAWLVPTQAE